MERRQFTDEFECDAVRLVSQAGISKEEISKDLGIKPTSSSLGAGAGRQSNKDRWQKKRGVSSEEFERMRRELAKVRTELQLRLLRRDWNNADCLFRASSTSARDTGLPLLDFIMASD